MKGSTEQKEFILNIHTATQNAIVNLCSGNEVLSTRTNNDPKQHASFLHIAVQDLLNENNIHMSELWAIGVTAGPGSYTGIRVGLASAKGFCYSLKIPLITFNTLEVMAYAATKEIEDKNAFYSPMIDARRMEVFTAVYNYDLTEMVAPSAVILSDNLFPELLGKQPVYFFGDGSLKLPSAIKNMSTVFVTGSEITSEFLGRFSYNKYKKNEFVDTAYAAPMYIKEFYSTQIRE